MLTAADMKVFLASDLSVSGAFLGASALLTRWKEPAESAAIAFAVMYAVHLAVSLAYVLLRARLKLSGKAIAVWASGMALVSVAAFAGWGA